MVKVKILSVGICLKSIQSLVLNMYMSSSNTCSNESVTSCGQVSSMNLVCVGYSVMISLLRTRSVSEPTEPKRTLEILGRAFALARVIILGLGHRFATPFSVHLRFATQFGLNLRFATQLDLRFRFVTQFCDRFL